MEYIQGVRYKLFLDYEIMRLHKNWNCKYCPATFSSRKKLWEHHKICEFCPRDSLGRVKLSKEDNLKRALTFSNNCKTGKILPSVRKHTPDEIRKMSESTKKYLEKAKTTGGARYSIKACKFIDELNKKNNWHLQHGMNGGEIRVGKYYLDGYDKDLNIAFEYDEIKKHNKNFDKDVTKQKFIKEKLQCRFFRYLESENKLIEV